VTMKTLQPPSTPAQKWPKQITCKKSSCKAVLEYVEEDVHYGDFGCPRDPGDVSMRFYVTCPHCQTTLFIPEEKLPDTFVIKLKDTYKKIHRS